jgi:DNA-binding NtrC family response regulator
MKPLILLIEEDSDVRDSLGCALRAEGYDIAVASNGREALNALRATAFGLVVLELDQPVTKGWETLSHIVTISLSLPLIIVTGRPDLHRLDTQKGVTAVLEKPLNLPLLLGVMERALAGMPARRAHAGKVGSP